jgi:3-hydroxy-9,10-secoandrosta-1,3,5(10)-triene-9,17-dione monooxygenase
MSSAWVGGVIAVHAFQLALMDERARQDVWGQAIHTRVSSSCAPLGKVSAVDGEFRLSGRWGWSSGSDHCSWVLLGAIVPQEGYRSFLLPRSEHVIEDTWHSMGLQGAGSNDFVVADAFLPDYRTHKLIDGFTGNNPGVALKTAPLYRLPWAQTFIRVVSTPATSPNWPAVWLHWSALHLPAVKYSSGFSISTPPVPTSRITRPPLRAIWVP